MLKANHCDIICNETNHNSDHNNSSTTTTNTSAQQQQQQQSRCDKSDKHQVCALEGELLHLRKQYQGTHPNSLDVDAILQNNRALVELFRSIENSVKQQDILRGSSAAGTGNGSLFNDDDDDEEDDKDDEKEEAGEEDNRKNQQPHSNSNNNVGTVISDLDFLFEGLHRTMQRREKDEASTNSHQHQHQQPLTPTNGTHTGANKTPIPGWKEQFRPKQPLSIAKRHDREATASNEDNNGENDRPRLPRQRSHSDIVILGIAPSEKTENSTTTSTLPTSTTATVNNLEGKSRQFHDKRPRSCSNYNQEHPRRHHVRRQSIDDECTSSTSASSSESSPFTPLSPPHKTSRREKNFESLTKTTTTTTTTTTKSKKSIKTTATDHIAPAAAAAAVDSSQSSSTTAQKPVAPQPMEIDSEQTLAKVPEPQDNKKDLLILLLLQHLCQQYHVSSSFFMNMCKKLKQLGYLDSVDIGTLKQANRELFTDIVTRWPRTFTSREDPEAAVLRRSESESALTSKASNFRSSNSLASGASGADFQQIQTARMPLFNFLFYSTSRFKLDFQMVSKLGRGGFGSAVKARHRIDGNEYAIKNVRFTFTNPGELERTYTRVVREVEAIARLDHPNVVRYYQAWFEPYHHHRGSQFDDHEHEDDEEGDDEEDNFDEHGNSRDSAQHPHEADENQNVFGFEMFDDLMEISNENDTNGAGSSVDHAIVTATDNGSGFIPTNFAVQQDMLLNDRELYHSDRISSNSIRFESYHPSQNNSPEGSPPLIGVACSPDPKQQNAIMGRISEILGKNGNESVRPNDGALNLHKSSKDQCRDEGINAVIRNMVQEMYNPRKLRFEAMLYIQMALCLPITLEDWLWSEGRISSRRIDLQEVNSKFKQIVEGLAHIHSKGVIHRDLKPSNLFLSPDGLIKIGDFGLSTHTTFTDHEDVNRNPSAAASLPSRPHIYHHHTSGVGTFAYASPEQLSGTSYDVQVDIYSLGIILFEMLHLFSTNSERVFEISELRKKGILSNSDRQQFPVHSKLIEQCLRVNPLQRPTSAQLLQHDLFSSNAQNQIHSLEQQLRQKDLELEEHRTLIAKLQQQLTFLTSTGTGVGSSNLSTILAGQGTPNVSPDMLPA